MRSETALAEKLPAELRVPLLSCWIECRIRTKPHRCDRNLKSWIARFRSRGTRFQALVVLDMYMTLQRCSQNVRKAFGCGPLNRVGLDFGTSENGNPTLPEKKRKTLPLLPLLQQRLYASGSDSERTLASAADSKKWHKD